MKTPAIKRTLLMAGLLSMMVAGLISCDKDPITGQSKKNMKFTLSAAGVAADDDLNIHFTGSAMPNETTIWKVNGTPQANQVNITITKAQLTSGNVIVETAVPLQTVVAAVSATNRAGAGFSFQIIPVVDGTTGTTVNQTVTTTFSQNYSY